MVLIDSNLDKVRWTKLLALASKDLVSLLEDENEVSLSSVNIGWDGHKDIGKLSSLEVESDKCLLKEG